MELAAALVLAAFAQADAPLPADRAHRAMFALPGGKHEPDPLFWPPDIKPWSFAADLFPALDALLADLPKDPIRRALLQHDAWMFFDALEGFPLAGGRSWPPGDAADRDAVRRRMGRLLPRLALTPEELKALTDPYVRAVEAKTFPDAFDPKEPARPFLPPDLDRPDGPWVLLGDPDGKPLALHHATHFMGHATFLIYISLPAGREATLDYLERLSKLKAAKDLPQPPEGSRLLLRRRAMLLDARGEPVLSPITQEVQIRVARPAGERAEGDGVFDFRLRRAELADGKPGLHATGVGDREPVFFFHRGPARDPVRSTCRECHGGSAVPSSVLRNAGRDRQGHFLTDGRAALVSTPEREAEATVAAKRSDRTWTTLRGLWPRD